MATPLDDHAATELRELIIRSMHDCGFDHTANGQFVLWNRVVSGYAPDDPNASAEKLYDPTIQQLRELSLAAGGWWCFPDHEDGQGDLGDGQFVALDEWQAIHTEKGVDWPAVRD